MVRLDARFNRALSFASQKDWLRILVKVGFQPGYAEVSARSPIFGRVREFGALDLGGSGTAFHPELAADTAQLVIVKPRISAFSATGLEVALRANRIERFIIADVSTTWAVQATACARPRL